METVVVNLNGSVRRESLHGRPHLVVPVTMIVPGVLPGSRGPLLYRPEQVAASVDAWNGMPIVVNHPKGADGQHVSARHPTIIERYGIGHIYEAKYADKLTAEAWIDEAQARRKAPAVLANLEAGKPHEQSTGLFTKTLAANGEHEGKPYAGEAADLRPDHLAVLTHDTGACSVADGCGLNVNSQKPDEDRRSWIRRLLANVWSDKARAAAAAARLKAASADVAKAREGVAGAKADLARHHVAVDAGRKALEAFGASALADIHARRDAAIAAIKEKYAAKAAARDAKYAAKRAAR